MVGKSLLARLFGKHGSSVVQPKTRRASAPPRPPAKNGEHGPRPEFSAAAKEVFGEELDTKTPVAVAVEPETAPVPITPVVKTDPEPREVPAEAMSPREEMSLKITDGLKGLSTILTDIDAKLDDQSRKSTELVQSIRVLPDMMRDLPETSRAGIELLATISRVLEDQTRATRDMVDRVKEMPALVTKVTTHLEEQAEAIKGQHESHVALRETVRDVGSEVKRMAEERRQQDEKLSARQEQVQTRTLDELHRMQDLYQARLADLSQRSHSQTRIITVMTVLIVLVFFAVLTRL
jgi:hypothetical protein